jgi:hypothetical protein
MNRTIVPRRCGRPTGPRPLFVEECLRVDATELLAKSRGGSPHDGLMLFSATVTWTEGGRTRARFLVLPVISTVQPFGGVRRWWRCPKCARRCRVLLVTSDASPVACRRCLGAVYSADYPGRHRWRQLGTLLRGFVSDGSLTLDEQGERELDLLLAKRRRGIRRGRRVLRRALRRLAHMRTEPDAVEALVNQYAGEAARATSATFGDS